MALVNLEPVEKQLEILNDKMDTMIMLLMKLLEALREKE